ncbi:MAG: hypothetical protein QOH71_1703 [Blastocatellia bacterium]|jgi:hypothetical protein|nr:hypothetical protein [Blastocatellia bacterium]
MTTNIEKTKQPEHQDISPPPCVYPAKWAAQVDDKVIPMPAQMVKVTVIKAQACVAEDKVLVRDHNSPDDLIIGDNEVVDLAGGNVFYTLAVCDVQPRPGCTEPPKLAFFVNDSAEVTIRKSQTGQTLRDLFGLPLHANLVRDDEGGSDKPISVTDAVEFEDGPVFYSRAVVAELSITVNAQKFTEHDGVHHIMTGEQIATLVYAQNPRETRVWEVSPEKRKIELDKEIEIRGCEVFDVVRKKVDGGYEVTRLELELAKVRESGQVVTHTENPAAVIYHDLRTGPGNAVPKTDVLVVIPGGYPGQMLDGAYLPEGSPLIGKVKGSPQTPLTALGRTWRLMSYHPHNGGGAAAWNPAVHGFHTYVGELLSWLYDAN